MIEILLKASLAIAVALLFYKLFLQQESFFATNRIYLIVCLVLAFLLPNINLPKIVEQQGFLSNLFQPDSYQEEAASTGTVLEEPSLKSETYPLPEKEVAVVERFSRSEETAVSSSESTRRASPTNVHTSEFSGTMGIENEAFFSQSFTWSFWLVAIYLFGVAVFSLSLFYQLGYIAFKILRSRDKVRDGDCVIVNTSRKQAPCSFFNYIFIYPDDYDFETYEQIIAHEKTHVRLGHSFDVLLAEIAVIVLWFNPLIWMFRKEIEKNNEYQTDAMLLEKEQVRREKYQINLLSIAVPHQPLNITTNYNQSLIKQRIVMMNSKKSTPNAYWKYTFLLPMFFGILLLINEPASSQDLPETSSQAEENVVSSEKVVNNVQPKVINGEITVKTSEAVVQSVTVVNEEQQILEEKEVRQVMNPVLEPFSSREVIREEISVNESVRSSQQQDMSTGYWYSSRKNGEYCIQFKGSEDRSSWNMSRCFNISDFQKQGNGVFAYTNETGTLELSGNLDAEVGQGKYIFRENAGFKNFLSENGITTTDKNFMFHLFFGDMNRSYVNFLKSEYGSIEGSRLMELAIHDIPQESYKNYIALFQKYSNKKPAIQEVIEARIHRIDEAYVEEIQRMGFKDLSMRKMMTAKIHGVSASYANDLKNAGYNNLSLDKIIEARIHRIDPETIKEMRSLGYGDLSLDKVIQLKIHEVNADYIQSLKNAGFPDLSLDEVVSARIHRVDPSAIKEIRALGFGDLSLKKITELRVHKVDADYIKQLKAANLGDLSLDQILTARIHRITPESIEEIRNLGYPDLNFRDILNAKIHKIDVAYVEDLRKAGFIDLPMDKVVSARIHGINSNFIEQYRQKGYNLDSIDKYISLKIHGSAMENLKN